MTAPVTLQPNAALVIVDLQEGFKSRKWGERNNPDAEANIARLLAAWRQTGRPVVIFQHRSRHPDSLLHPSQPGYRLQRVAEPEPGEAVMQKTVNSCFIGTDLEAWLRARDIEQVVMTGLTTPHCVSTTTRMAENLGFAPIVVSDATASFAVAGPDGREHPAAEVHEIALAVLHGEFAAVMTTSAVLRAAAVAA